MGKRSRDKGARTERAVAKLIGARKVSRAWAHDLELDLAHRTLKIECKARAAGFGQLYDWLAGNDALIVKADRLPPLVVLRLSLAAELVGISSGSSMSATG
jgi:hypothetical protein